MIGMLLILVVVVIRIAGLLVVVMAEGKEDSMQVDDGKQGDREAHGDRYVMRNAGALNELGHRSDSAHNKRKTNDSVSNSEKDMR